MIYGYARVSTADQCLDRQIDALKNYKVDKIHCEKISGTKKNRPELDKEYYGIEIAYSLSELSTNEFIEYKLKEMKKGYKFLIFIGEGEFVNSIPTVIKTRFKNRIRRSIYLKMQYRNGSGVITDCHYYDRKYKEKSQVIPETLSTVYFEYTRQVILNIINNELNTAFTDIIFVTDGSLSIDNKLPLCGYII